MLKVYFTSSIYILQMNLYSQVAFKLNETGRCIAVLQRFSKCKILVGFYFKWRIRETLGAPVIDCFLQEFAVKGLLLPFTGG